MTQAYRGSPPDKGSNTEQRRAHRRTVAVNAKVRQSGSLQFDVDLVDLSTSGFQVKTAMLLSRGSRVWLTLPTFEALEARVAWCDHYRLGCSFTAPLHLAVLDHIVARDTPRAAAHGR